MNDNKCDNDIPQWKKDLMKFRDDYNEKETNTKKYSDTLKYSNQMLEECKRKNFEKNEPSVAKHIADGIDKAIDENKCEIEKCEEKTYLKKFGILTENKQTTNFMNPFDNVDFSEYNANNRFLITVESGLFNAKPVNIRSFWHDDLNRIKINMIEPIDQCLPMLLDTSIDKGVTYKITKSIIKAKGEIAYSVVYTGCKVMDYTESALDYSDINLRTFTITLDYKDYTYDV